MSGAARLVLGKRGEGGPGLTCPPPPLLVTYEKYEEGEEGRHPPYPPTLVVEHLPIPGGKPGGDALALEGIAVATVCGK